MNLDRIIAVRTDKTIYRDGDKCLKVFVGGRSASDIYCEAMNQAIFCEKGLCVPKALEVTCIDGKWTLVSEFVRGKTLARMILDEPEKRREYIAEFAELHHSIHAHSSDSLHNLKKTLNAVIPTVPLELEYRAELRMMADMLPDSDHICHGDFDPSNIIVTPLGETYVTDFPLAVSGAPEFDAAVAYLKLMLGYDGIADEYLAAFTGENRKLREKIEALFPLAAAFMLKRSNAERRNILCDLIKNKLQTAEAKK